MEYEMKTLGQAISLRLRINPAFWLTIPNFSYKYLFQFLNVENIATVVNAILMEKQIIFMCSRQDVIAQVTETLLSMILPL